MEFGASLTLSPSSLSDIGIWHANLELGLQSPSCAS
jgi:hypothetical protein